MKNIETTIGMNGINLNLTVNIPFCNKQQHGADFDLDRARTRCINYSLDLIGAYSGLLIGTLQRRLQACQINLLNHLNDIEYSDICGHIVYVRKDGTRGQFNTSSFEQMKNAVKALQQSEFKAFVQNKIWIDQTLKALLNDTEQHHDDLKEFKYSELISLLCELQTSESLAFQ